MKIFVLNCGSSSIKYQLIDSEAKKVTAKGLLERIGTEGSFLKHYSVYDYAIEIKRPVANHTEGIQMVLDALVHKDYGVIKDLSEIQPSDTGWCTAVKSFMSRCSLTSRS